MEKGLNPGGYLVCKFAFKVCLFSGLRFHSCLRQTSLQRIENQPPLPVRDLEAEAATRNQVKDGESDAQNEEESDEDEAENEDADADGDAEAEVEDEEPEEQA
jgi:hypothetical protein